MASLLTNPQVINLAVMLGVIQISNRLDLENPDNLNLIRFGYVATQVVCFLAFAYIYSRIVAKNDTTTFIYEEPAAPFSGEKPEQKRLTNTEYDLSELTKAGKTQLIGIAIMGFMHLKMLYTRPLFIQAIFGLRTLYQLPLFKVYILNKKPTGDLARPWSANTPFSPKPTPISEKEAESKAKREEKKRIKKKD